LNNGKKNQRREKPGSNYKTNEQITCPQVRVIEGIDQGIYDTNEALAEAQRLGLDLILITESANPPVCKILDFSKFLYEEKRKKKANAANQIKTVVKEVQFTPNIGENDYNVKKKNVIKFLENGNKVKVSVFFSGRNIMFKDRGELLLAKLATEIEDVGIPESMPQMFGKNMMFIIKPKKAK
jgi:translation initiation factor IF-3